MPIFNTLKIVLVLLTTLGFPRFYGTEIPMFTILIPLFYKDILSFYLTYKRKTKFFLIGFGTFVSIGVIQYYFNKSSSADLFFHMILSAKILINLFAGIVIFKMFEKGTTPIVIWITLQYLFIYLSSISIDFYMFMIEFISPRSAEMFKSVFGYRTAGFGVMHTDGVFILLIATIIILKKRNYDLLSLVLLALLLPISMSMARIILVLVIPFVLLSFNRKIYITMILSGIIMLIMMNTIKSGAFYEATEPFRKTVLKTQSVQVLYSMGKIPVDYKTFLIGDGKYFDSSVTHTIGFYKKTDIGYTRLVFFGGLAYLLVFIFINLIYFKLDIISLKSIFSPKSVIYFLQKNSFRLTILATFLIVNYKTIHIVVLATILDTLYEDDSLL